MNHPKGNSFHGGIHPTDGFDKGLSLKTPIQAYMPKQVEISMEQSFGGTCQLLVKKGDKVAFGQLIGKPAAFLAAPLHASISGVVSEIKKVTNAAGREVEVCVIAGDGNENPQEAHPYQKEIQSLEGISREDIVTAMEEGGIIGMGGAGFPTHIKYKTKSPIEAVLVNGAECEPFLTCDHMLMLHYGKEIINGVALLVKASGAPKAVLCIEDNKKEAIQCLREILEGTQLPITICELPAKYPQGGERQLIQSVLGKEVPSGGLPADAGVIVSNIATAKAVADMVFAKRPLTSRIITITGCVKNPGNYLVPIGTPIQELIKCAGDVTCAENKVILGGPMTGTCIGTDLTSQDPMGSVSKTSSGVVVLENDRWQESPCIRCGECARICPAGLNPFQIDFAFLEEDFGLCEKLHAAECIACGSCSYVCPARRELAYRSRMARDKVKAMMRERGTK